MTKAPFAACVLAALLAPTPLLASPRQFQRPSTQPPPPAGQRIVARDGDVIVIEDDARVRIVRRREANVRLIFNSTERWLVVLADFVVPNGADGRVDMTYTFYDITGDWPIEARWEGAGTIEENTNPGAVGSPSFGLVLPGGTVQLAGPTSATFAQDTNALATLTFRGSGRGSGPSRSFDEAEPLQIANARRNAQNDRRGPSNVQSSISMTTGTGSAASGVVVTAGEQAPVRVGGDIRQPAKLVDAQPVYPEVARNAGIRGVVILELTIDTDGSVKEARVLRSIPLLDAAAVAAAQQWRFEPTLLNGRPVPVVLTATVQF